MSLHILKISPSTHYVRSPEQLFTEALIIIYYFGALIVSAAVLGENIIRLGNPCWLFAIVIISVEF